MVFQQSFLDLFGAAIALELGAVVAVGFVVSVWRLTLPRLSERIKIAKRFES